MPFSDEAQFEVTDRPKLTSAVLLVGAALFFSSLLPEAFATDFYLEWHVGWEAFFAGWYASLGGNAGVSWLANPMLFAAWFLLDRAKKSASVFAILAVLFSLSFLFFEKVLITVRPHRYESIERIGIGYWLWVSSCIVTLAGSLIIRPKIKTRVV